MFSSCMSPMCKKNRLRCSSLVTSADARSPIAEKILAADPVSALHDARKEKEAGRPATGSVRKTPTFSDSSPSTSTRYSYRVSGIRWDSVSLVSPCDSTDRPTALDTVTLRPAPPVAAAAAATSVLFSSDVSSKLPVDEATTRSPCPLSSFTVMVASVDDTPPLTMYCTQPAPMQSGTPDASEARSIAPCRDSCFTKKSASLGSLDPLNIM
mmetsp:Transcript_8829/g.28192  ORF Transcript_8829/g.28192 Transcript_8829/m.28192 type:complete len:211 (+) Transcript_8829:1866-2498(+)